MLKNYNDGLLIRAMDLIEMNNKHVFDLAEVYAKRADVDAKKSKVLLISTMKRLLSVVESDEYDLDSNLSLAAAVSTVADACTESVEDPRIFTDEDLKVYVCVCAACLEHDAYDSVTEVSSSHLLFITIMFKLSTWLRTLNRFDLAAELRPGMLKTLESGNCEVPTCYSKFLSDFEETSSGRPIAMKDQDRILQMYLDSKDAMLLNSINKLYPENPSPVKAHFRTMMDTLAGTMDSSALANLTQIILQVCSDEPELFTEEDIEMLINKARNYTSIQPLLLQIVQELCNRRPEVMVKHIDTLMDRSAWIPTLQPGMNGFLCSLALHDKGVAPKTIDYLFESVRTKQDKGNLFTALNSARIIGYEYPDIIKPRRDELLKLKVLDPDAQQIKQTILDIIDGKTTEDVKRQVEAQQQNLNTLVNRVDDTEDVVAEVKVEMGKQGEKLDNMTNEVTVQGQRLTQVEGTVEDTVAKVEEIDQKTLSSAPFWSRDVSKILNPQSKHDWRLLSSRLGYSNDDIRGWAQQADPCMAMLNEWYATRKTSEATFAILTLLQEMNRLDAAAIVENAMKNAEAVVEDEEFEYASPPPIFISYQWAHQAEVKLLKQHLEMAGYDCWLDIGQMGGGDKLFEKIDNGIRAAKVVISCVTDKYAKSPNCNREVNLSVSLNKSLIPLQLEKCNWPPPGSMGPIFSEYLFIRFFQRAGEETEDERYWPTPKFQELLMQLSQFGLPPDAGKIQPVYRNWWMPVVEEIKIDKSKTKNGGQVAGALQRDADKKDEKSPEIFISYQWGKQNNIIKLFERLSSLGFTCWLDIKQMGGGDSLYDKIDKGIRGSKVVLSCVTQKYALSANCRREVSLADALQKPLIPLLLEKMSWPPSGPMSMVMTQLMYINFSKDESEQMTWDGAKSQELLDKINSHIPRTIMDPSPKLQSVTAAKTAGAKSSSAEQQPKSSLQTPKQPNKTQSLWQQAQSKQTNSTQSSSTCIII